MSKLSVQQRRALEETARENAEAGNKTDHMSYSGVAGGAVEYDPHWANGIADLSDYMQRNALSAMNKSTLECYSDPIRRRVLAPDGFKSAVRYVRAAPSAYVSWTKDVDREIKQIVLHSFGHQWHAYRTGGKWRGPLNDFEAEVRAAEKQDVVDHSFFSDPGHVGTNIVLPKGTDVSAGFTNWNRFTATLRTLIEAPAGTSGVHYLIARNGDLYVMADANDIMRSCGVFNETALSIGLEESMFMTYTHQRPIATWSHEGEVPGTAGSASYWKYSELQYDTLAILMRKLGNAIPSLDIRTNSLGKIKKPESFIGHTMHSHLPDAKPEHIDVSPHLATQEDWNALYDRIKSFGYVSEFNTWYTQQKGFRSRLRWVEEAVEALGPEPDKAITGVSTNPAVNTLLGVYRAHQEILREPSSYRTAAAAISEAESKAHAQRKGAVEVFEAAATAPTVTPNVDPDSLKKGELADDRQGVFDLDGILPGTYRLEEA